MTSRDYCLVVDDEPNFCETMKDILEEFGCKVITATNGLEAIEMVRIGNFKFVLMDIRMPLMNGVEALALMKMIKPDINYVMMTAYSDQEWITLAKELGVKKVLYKPIAFDELFTFMSDLKSK
ncbi:MAG: response regulator [Promethearchaeota archaeon]